MLREWLISIVMEAIERFRTRGFKSLNVDEILIKVTVEKEEAEKMLDTLKAKAEAVSAVLAKMN
jgi:hypothetical protein